jgi:ABC-2 type transport system permease protein
MNRFSFGRFLAVLHKEWIQVRRDPMTLRLIIALPVLQLFLFGYAINTDPKHLPTGLLSPEHSQYVRTIVAALHNTGYYDIRPLTSEAAAERALAEGEVLFVINIPPNFERSVDRGETPAILVDADATDPSAIGNATAALASLTATLNRDLPPKLQAEPAKPPFQFVVHARYNPEQLTVLNIVPGLVCIVLTFSTLIITTLSITRERERGTMENLLAMPVRPIEVMVAKIVPYIAIGYVQVVLIMAISSAVFDLPVRGSLFLLLLALGLFIASNLAGLYLFDDCNEPDAGYADGAIHLAAVDLAVRFHVSVLRHAELGAVGGRDFPDDPSAARRARHPAQGQWRHGDSPRAVADRRLHIGGRRNRDLVLPRDAGLMEISQSAPARNRSIFGPA